MVRLARTLGLLLLVALALFGLHELFGVPGREVTITLSLLLGLPYSLGAIATFLNDPTGNRQMMPTAFLAAFFVLTVLFIGGIILREGVICMVILSPLWAFGAAMGAITVRMFQARFHRSTTNCLLLAALPFALLVTEAYVPERTQVFEVTRTATIHATRDQVWEELLALENIEMNEGRWNITQNVLGVPRPRSAVIVGNGQGAKRHAKWGDKISFEEHIFDWHDGFRMRWQFFFPNASVSQYTDRHISPNGEHLRVLYGGYDLISLSPMETTLVLETTYEVTTPLNLYSGLWGELILGDIQSNILQIVTKRAERERI